MIWRLLADGVLVLHGLFVLFVMLGGFLVLRWPRLAWLHVPAALWGAAIEFGGWICPLTPLEVALRQSGGAAGYAGGFVEHYVTAALYPDGLTRPVQLGLGAMVLLVNGVAYWLVRQRLRARRGPAAP
jgi:hypothetical protein